MYLDNWMKLQIWTYLWALLNNSQNEGRELVRTGSKSNLVNTAHSGDTPHQCDKCNKAFVTNSKLREHMATQILPILQAPSYM
jgi:hypothetical protein